MAKKKAIKLAAASAIAASAFVAAAPAQADAASNVATEVSKAVTQMKKAYHTYSDVTATGKFADIKAVYAEYNAAKKAYANAKAVVTKAGGATKDAYLAQLDSTYAEYISKRVVTYIDAYNYAVALDAKREALEAELTAKDWDGAEKLYHEISYELKTRTVILDRVYGKSTRELLRSSFKADAQASRDSIANEVTVKIAVEAAADLVAEGKLVEAKAQLDKAAQFAAKLDKDSNFGKALLTEQAAAVAAYEAKLTPAVESVTAINAKELVVKFNKAIKKDTIIEASGLNAGTLVDGIVKVDNALVNSYTAELSADGKELTITSTGTWDGTRSIEVLADKIESTDGKKVGQFSTVFTFADTTRASVKEVKYVNARTAEIHLDEPIASFGTATAAYEDSTLGAIVVGAPAADSTTQVNVTLTSPKVITVDLSDAQLLSDKNVVVTLPALTDAAGNVSKPVTVTVAKSTADKVKPVISSVTATGFDGTNTTFDIKLSEAIAESSVAGITVNGNAVTATVDSKDKTVLHATVAAKITGNALVYVPANAFTDLSSNGNAEVGSYFTFTLDTVAPTLSSSTVERVNGKETLVLSFSENVTVDTAKNFTVSTTDQYGVTTSQAYAATTANGVSLYNPVNGVSSKVAIDLTDADLAFLADNKNFKVTLDAGFVKDATNNPSAKVSDVAFATTVRNVPSGQVTATIVADPKITSSVAPGVVVVNFDKAVDVASATSVSNYVVEDATVKEVKLIANSASGATVHVILNDGTVEATGNYNVTVKGIKPFSSADTANKETVASVKLYENVRATLTSTVVSNLQADTFTVKLTFNDATVANTGVAKDFELYVDGKATGEKLDVAVSGGAVTLTWADADDTSIDVASLLTASSVKLVAVDTIDIKDANGNVVNVGDIVIK